MIPYPLMFLLAAVAIETIGIVRTDFLSEKSVLPRCLLN